MGWNMQLFSSSSIFDHFGGENKKAWNRQHLEANGPKFDHNLTQKLRSSKCGKLGHEIGNKMNWPKIDQQMAKIWPKFDPNLTWNRQHWEAKATKWIGQKVAKKWPKFDLKSSTLGGKSNKWIDHNLTSIWPKFDQNLCIARTKRWGLLFYFFFFFCFKRKSCKRTNAFISW